MASKFYAVILLAMILPALLTSVNGAGETCEKGDSYQDIEKCQSCVCELDKTGQEDEFCLYDFTLGPHCDDTFQPRSTQALPVRDQGSIISGSLDRTMESKNEGTTQELLNGWNSAAALDQVKERFPRMPESVMLKARNLVMALLNLPENSILELESASSPNEGSPSAEQASVVNRNPLELETILNKVLRYLPVNSLLNARLVNQTWNSLAVDWIKKKRVSWVDVEDDELPRLCSDFEECEFLPFSNLKLTNPGERLENVVPFFVQHGRSVEGLKFTNTLLNPDSRKALGSIFKLLPNLKRLHIDGISPYGYAPGTLLFESDETIQLRKVEYLNISAKQTPLHKQFLDQVFALIPNFKMVSLSCAPSQGSIVAEALRNLKLGFVYSEYCSEQFQKFFAGSRNHNTLNYLGLQSRPSHDLVLVEQQEDLLRSLSKSLQYLKLLNQTTPNNRNERALLQFPVMQNLRVLELDFSRRGLGLNKIPLMVPLQPDQVPRLRSLIIGDDDVLSLLLAPTPFTSVEEIQLYESEVSNCHLLPEMVSMFPNVKKLYRLTTILEAQDMARIVSCLPDIEVLQLRVHNNPRQEGVDFTAFISGISMDQKLTLCELAEHVGIESVLSWIETPGPSLRDLKRLRELQIVFNMGEDEESKFEIDELGVYMTLLRLSPTLDLTLYGDFSISTQLASKLTEHFQTIYLIPIDESYFLPGGDVYFRPSPK